MTTTAAGPWRDLRLRLASAALLGPLVLACIWLGEGWFSALIALTMLGLGWEWVRMAGGASLSRQGLALPVSVVAASLLAALGLALAGLVLLLAGAAAAYALAGRLPGRLPGRFLAAGVLYIGLAGLALITLRQDAAVGRANLVFIILLVWASDSAAYLAGRALGGPRLWPAISPGKTWSGALGGLLGAMLVGALAALLVPPPAPLAWAALVAGVLGVLSQAGDLLESAIKRYFGVKDSSHLIPGHGGLLDRLDGILAVAPAAALLALACGSGVHLWR